MNRLLTYTLTLLAALLLTFSCSQAEVTEPGAGGDTGTLDLRITGTRTDEGGYNPFDHLTVRIFNSKDALVRKYTSQASIPASLELLADEYRITVEAGDRSAASFTNKSYSGENTFTIIGGTTSNVEVVCKLVNTAAQVKFDASIATNFGSEFKVQVCANNEYNESAIAGGVPTLEYTSDKTGYFILPEGVHNLSWGFRGTHPKHGEVIKTGVFENVEPGNRYTVTLRYSPDLPGYIGLTLSVDTSTDDWDDTIIFSPDPTIKGADFDLTEMQKYVSGEKSFQITSMGALESIDFEFAGVTYKAFDYLEGGVTVSGTRSESGIITKRTDDYNATVTLNEAFFTGKPGGNTPLRFQIKDVDGGSLSSETVFRLQGLTAVSSADQDLWNNTVTLRALVFNESVSTVTFSLSKPGGEWIEAEGTRIDAETFEATIHPTWKETTNEAGLTVYTPETGVFAGNSYEYKVAFDQQEAGRSTFIAGIGQTIQDSDMENGALGCFGNSSGPFWGSGNNSMSDPLCIYSSFNGMEGAHCAKLAASKPLALVNLAAGNLFTGNFKQSGLSGTVTFGVPYSWTARPKAISVRYYGILGNVNQNQHKGPLSNGTPDQSRIFLAIVDWDAPHAVTSGSSAPSGIWDPAKMTSVAEGAIIGYGSIFQEGTTPGDSMVELVLPIHYYDTQTKPGKNLGLVISAATSAYGDYMNGCTTSVMYVDDFKWVY